MYPRRLPTCVLLLATASSCGGERLSAVSAGASSTPPPEAASAVALPPALPAQRPRAATAERAPCERAASLRARVTGLLAEGRLDRTRRALMRANELCPATARETWAAEVATLTELGAVDDARKLAKTIAQAKDAPAEAKDAARRAEAEMARLARPLGGLARDAWKRRYADAAAAFLRKDYEAAVRGALKAWATYHPNPNALVLAGRAARAGGDPRAAQRLFDRARAEAERDYPPSEPCSPQDMCEGKVDLPEGSPRQTGLMFSPASGFTAVSRSDGIMILDANGQYRARLDLAPGGSPTPIAFLPDGLRVVKMPHLRASDGAAIYDAATGTLLRQMPDFVWTRQAQPSLQNLCLSPDGTNLAGAVSAGKSAWELWIWDIESGSKLASAKIGSPVSWMAYAGGGKYIALRHYINGDDGHEEALKLYDAKTGRVVRRLPTDEKVGPTSSIFAVSPDGATISGIFDGAWRLVDVATGKLTAELAHTKIQSLRGATPSARAAIFAQMSSAFSPDGKLVLLALGHRVEVAEVATGKTVAIPPLPGPPGDVDGAVFTDARHVLLGRGGLVWEWEVGASAVRVKYGPPIVHQGAVSFSPDDSLIATGLEDGNLALWNLASPSPVRRLSGHTGPITGVAFSREGAMLLSASRDGTLRAWDVASGQVLRVFAGHGGAVTSLTLSPSGKILASGSEDRTVRLWDVSTGVELRRIDHPAVVVAVAFSDGGRRLATGAEDGGLRIFDPSSGAALGSMATNKPVRSVLWTGAGELTSFDSLADQVSRLPPWDMVNGAEQKQARIWISPGAATRSDDGRLVAATGFHGDPVALLDSASLKHVRSFVSSLSRDGGGLAFSHGGARVAVASLDALTLFRTSGPVHSAEITARVTPGLAGGIGLTSDGHFDIIGPDAEAIRRVSRCVITIRPWPFELCEERLRVPGLFAKVGEGDDSYREP